MTTRADSPWSSRPVSKATPPEGTEVEVAVWGAASRLTNTSVSPTATEIALEPPGPRNSNDSISIVTARGTVAPPVSPPGGDTGGATVPRAVTIEIESFEFRGPGGSSAISVAVGDTLVFVNRDAAPHTATSTSVPSGGVAFDTGRLDQGESARVVITAPGSYAFRCDFHPAMTGAV